MTELRDRSFKHFDLPVNHLSRHAHYVPPKARDEIEIERRRNLKPGMLLAEHQARGTRVAAKMLEFLQDKDESTFAPNLIAATGINTAWHNHAEDALDVMRRRLWLPVHARHEGLVTRDTLMEDAQEGISESAVLAWFIKLSMETRGAATLTYKKRFARKLGNSSLVLACVPKASLITTSFNSKEEQYHTRQAAMVALEASRNLEEKVGANPTMAQLADPDSPLSVYIRREGTNATVAALEFATSSEMSAQ